MGCASTIGIAAAICSVIARARRPLSMIWAPSGLRPNSSPGDHLIRSIPSSWRGSVLPMLHVSQAYEPHHHTTDHHCHGVSREWEDDLVATSPNQVGDGSHPPTW